MFKTLTTFLVALMLAILSLSALSSEQVVRERMQVLIPGAVPDAVTESPVAGVFEIRFGTQIFYMSGDGKYIFQGNLMDTETRASLTEISRARARKVVMDRLNESEMVIYPTRGETKHVITVFTDVDCTFCRRLHAEMAEINDLGIKVRYLMFPRTGVGSPSYLKAVSVWCAENRNAAMDQAKLGRDVPSKTCDDPVQAQMQLGEQMGVQGTPAIVLEGGEMLPGYRPAGELLSILEQVKNNGR